MAAGHACNVQLHLLCEVRGILLLHPGGEVCRSQRSYLLRDVSGCSPWHGKGGDM